MKKFWIGVAIVAAVGVLFFFAFLEMDWRYPSGPEGKIQVHYTIAEKGPRGTESASFSFWIAGHVECVQLVPISYHTNGFVALYIKTTEGWYESPRATVAPIDWKRGVQVDFHYPEGMKLRGKTADIIRGFYPAFGSGSLQWRTRILGLSSPLTEGDIANILFRQEDGVDVTVRRTSGLLHQGYAGGARSGVGVEVVISGK